jgi:hypothetical protein
LKVMTAWRQAIELSIGDEDVARRALITEAPTELAPGRLENPLKGGLPNNEPRGRPARS